MNKFINVLLLFILIPTMLFTIVVAFDIPIGFLKKYYVDVTIQQDGTMVSDVYATTVRQLPYQYEIFLGLGLIVFIINLRRTIRRWMGMRIVNRTNKFKWNTPVNDTRKKRVITYLILEGLVMAFVGTALYVLTPQAWFLGIAYGYVAIDNLIFGIVGAQGNRFRIGLSSKALIVADREVTVLYFKGLRKVSIHQQSIYFDYIKGLQLSFPSDCIQDENRGEFFKLLEDQLDPDRVFFSKKL